ncbi:patatin family protein [Vibrio sp. SM6]|uniref:Patatin family protein n=1 Tax=Vibrio agarilyticus TaxID=2726741 RepID=A0A7X8TPM6_9VIBR|nr:patatin family protein [Vibrio agarilyticus]NLS12627.1 patatin family protein [Vibrio agarilyticus]
MRSALVVEGGAMRGVFASGVLDAFINANYYPYDLAIGVSAGAPNLVGYLARQAERSYKVILELATDKRFYSPQRFLRGGDLIDVKWLITEAQQRYPLDTTHLFNSIPMLAVTTNIDTGDADYYQVNEQNLANVLEASCALPIAYRHTPTFSGGSYTDGGVADSIPVKEAYRRGARDITVVLSHPLNYQMPEYRHHWLTNTLLARQPRVAQAMRSRAKRYNDAIAFINQPPADTTMRVIAPPVGFHVRRLTMNPERLQHGYQIGRDAGATHLDHMTYSER